MGKGRKPLGDDYASRHTEIEVKCICFSQRSILKGVRLPRTIRVKNVLQEDYKINSLESLLRQIAMPYEIIGLIQPSEQIHKNTWLSNNI